MGTITVFSKADNKNYSVKTELFNTVISTGTTGGNEVYLKITTDMKKPDKTAFPEFMVRTLADVCPSCGAASNFTDLINGYVAYFIGNSEIETSSSSSSSEGNSSSSTTP